MNLAALVAVLLIIPVPSGEGFVTTDPADEITTESAMLHGRVADERRTGQGKFTWWGPSYPRNGTIVEVATNSTGSFRFRLTNLTPNTVYHFHAWAIDPDGNFLGEGEPLSFTTAARPEPFHLKPLDTLFLGLFLSVIIATVAALVSVGGRRKYE